MMSRGTRVIFRNPEGDAAAAAGAAGDAGAAAAVDWRAAVAGDDKAALDALKGVEHPGDLVKAYQGQVNWREGIAGDNADRLKTLERFTSPKQIYDSYEALRTRVSKGELKAVTPFPDKGTAEQQSQWRAENGVPPDGKYEIKLADGLVIGEHDKPVIEAFQKFAHDTNLPSNVVNAVVNWQFQQQAVRQEAAKAEFDAKRNDVTAALSHEWGAEYKPNLNKIAAVLDAYIPAEQTELKQQVGNAIATNAHFARMMAAIAMEMNPAGALVPGDRAATESTVVDGLKAIEKTMATNRKAYDKDEAMQTRYRELIGAYHKITGKEWGR